MGFLNTALGAAKLVSNFLGGGSGSSSNTTQNTSQTQNSNSKQVASRKEYSDAFLQNLELTAANALVNNANNQESIQAQTQKVQSANLGAKPAYNFDAEAYVRGVTEAARASINNDLEANTNAIAAQTGGSQAGNSQAALLAGKLRADSAKQIAGVTAEAQGNAAQIAGNLRQQQVAELQSGTEQVGSLASAGDAGLTSLLNALRGGETYQTVTADSTTQTNESGTKNTTTPFSWTAGLGNLFKNVGDE
jgi:hypothetical protein